MKADYEVIIQSPGVFARALSEPGKQYAIYIHNGSKCDLSLNLPAGKYSVEWVSTKAGGSKATEKIDHKGGRILIQSPDYIEDIALKIVRI
jgi:hypothetical protein